MAEAVAKAIGGARTGIRVSPYGVFTGISIHDELDEQYGLLAEALDGAALMHVHTVDHTAMGAPEVPATIKKIIRDKFSRAVMLSGGCDKSRAEADLAEGLGDLVAFGRPFISNPDLVERLAQDTEFASPNFDLFYTPGPEGYTDYPRLTA